MTTEAGSIERDPVCGMRVNPARATATEEHAGKTYYFCCRGCQEKFRAEPAKYLKSGGLHAPVRTGAFSVKVEPAAVPKTLVAITPAASHVMQIAPAPAHSIHRQDALPAAAPRSAAISKAANEY